MDKLEICRGLTPEQTGCLLGEFHTDAVTEGTELFGQGGEPERMFLVVRGRAAVSIDGDVVGSVGPGEGLGEVSFLSETPRSATAVAESDMEVGILTRESLDALVRRRPDIGAVVFRNLARGLGDKLRRADREVMAK
jgi:CRP-like cAMP-binding protein